MDKQNTNTRQGLEIGPVTENLLNALRELERAKNCYYSAFVEMGGEQAAAEEMSEAGPVWDAVGELIEKAITDGLRTWAATNEKTI